MGKNKKKKKNKKRTFYNKKEFVNIFCAKCSVCIGNPTFCYDNIYKSSPHLFLTKVHEALIEVKEWNSKRGGGLVFSPGQFRYAVCNNIAKDICGDENFATNCKHLETCYKEFKKQILGHGGRDLLIHRRKINKKKKRAKKKNKYIVKAYPTAFMSDNENWKKVIKRILIDGDDDKEQNKAEEGSV